MRLTALFIREGSSDDALIEVLRKIFGLLEVDEIDFETPDLAVVAAGNTVIQKVEAALTLVPNADLLFVHRDADARNPHPRFDEIKNAMIALGIVKPHVAIIPIQTTEAWLLLDESAIREVADNPRGRVNLNLPRPRYVEGIADPKERLQQALLNAAELQGRRLDIFRKNFTAHRRQLLELLEPEGNVRSVPSFQRLVQDIRDVIGLL